jgi:hypothetical protein
LPAQDGSGPSSAPDGALFFRSIRGNPAMNSHLSRRTFLAVGAGAAAWTTLGPLTAAAASIRRVGRPRSRKRVALLATEVWKYSHAQHFIDRLLEGYGWEGRHHYSPLELVALYVDHFPQNDLSRERAQRHHVTIYPSIAEALTQGGPKLAVDGVLIIGEHGKYPRNEKGQTLYPRYRFFSETMKVFEASGRAVPVFNDKHLSTDWSECLDMVQTAKRLDFPFLAGSSLPVTWRIPSVEMPWGTPLRQSVCVGYGGVDSYDFHGLETAQCMSERRKGGESGVRSVQALKGPAVWTLLETEPDTRRLFFAALARSFSARPPEGYTMAVPSLDWARRLCAEPIGYVCEHDDGFRTALFLVNGLVSDFTYAGLRRGNPEILSCQMYLPMPPAVTTLADFFNPLTHHVERMILEGKAPYPIERTLLTSGITAVAVESLYRGQVKIETPQLAVAYTAPRESTYWRA